MKPAKILKVWSPDGSGSSVGGHKLLQRDGGSVNEAEELLRAKHGHDLCLAEEIVLPSEAHRDESIGGRIAMVALVDEVREPDLAEPTLGWVDMVDLGSDSKLNEMICRKDPKEISLII